MTRKNPLKEVLERIFWAMDEVERASIVIYIIHRGAYQDVKLLDVSAITKFDNSYIYTGPDENEHGFNYAENIPIPYHRIIKVVNALTGKIYYQNEKKLKKETADG
ncbi:MAG: RNA repair domain-containing protein [Promethearchaeota archaeon]